MKLIRAFIRSRHPWAILAGLLLAVSFPKFSIAGLAWIAPAMMLLAALGKRGGEAFRIGYTAGIAYYFVSLYWLLLIPVRGYPILGWAALSAFLALYPATWVWLCWKLFSARLTGEGKVSTIENWSAQFLSTSWAQRLTWTLSCAALWVTWEMIIARFLGGFPWNLLGLSQYRLTPLIQVASSTGVYGISFLVVWSSLSLLAAGMVVIHKPTQRSAWFAEIILPLAIGAAIYAHGYNVMLGRYKLLGSEEKAPELTVALVQPSIPQNMIWDPKENAVRFQQLLELSEQALTNKPDLLVWPEAALPKRLRYDREINQAVTGLARAHKVWMIVGSDDSEPNPTTPDEPDFFNCSFLISPEGDLVERYKKRNLVIFGEYIPLIKWFPFIKYLTPIDGSFTSGDRVTPFLMGDLKAKVATLICFEDTFPHLVREYVSDDTDFLVVLTNDGWFGEGAAQWQHGAQSVFRAVENGVPIVRCSNNGLTCWIDSQGRVRHVFESSTHGIYGPGFMIARIPVLAPGETRTPTFYRQHGDVFGWSCVGFVALRLLQNRFSRRKTA